MTKKGPLSKAEKFYIENHLSLDVKILCRDLDRTQAAVNKFVGTLPKKEVVTTSKQGEKPVAPKPNISDQFARNKEGGATIMTPNASVMADDKRAQYRNKALQARNRSSCVTTIKDTNG